MSPNPQETADLVTFTEEILNRKLHFFCSEMNLRLTPNMDTILTSFFSNYFWSLGPRTDICANFGTFLVFLVLFIDKFLLYHTSLILLFWIMSFDVTNWIDHCLLDNVSLHMKLSIFPLCCLVSVQLLWSSLLSLFRLYTLRCNGSLMRKRPGKN